VHDGGAVVSQPAEIVAVEPDRVRGRKVRSQQTERIEMRGQRSSVFAQSEDRLRLGLGQMGLQRQTVVAR
jgi:hypothetical protein